MIKMNREEIKALLSSKPEVVRLDNLCENISGRLSIIVDGVEFEAFIPPGYSFEKKPIN